jgi:non-reducing end alpha-L-arabinofuranosidase
MKMKYPMLLASVAAMCFVGVLVACVPYTANEEEVKCADPYPVDNDETVPPFEGIPLPCDVLKQAGTTCASAHSTVRVIVTGYSGPLYQLCKGGSKPGPGSCTGQSQDIKAIDGYADAVSHQEFCGEDSCLITKLYDQSGNGNDLEPSPPGGAKTSADIPAKAMALPVKLNGHQAYGVLIKPGMGYRTGCRGCTIKTGKGMAVGDEPQSMYMITSQNDLVDGCCFDYGNAETSSNDDGNGTMEAVYFGAGVVWGTGYGGKPGPWVMGDLENGVFAGWEKGQDKLISTNKPLRFDFVTAIVVGDTSEKNCKKGRYMLYGADATGADGTYGKLMTMWDGIRPDKPGYAPMTKQGALILGTGGDNSSGGGGRFYEGATATGPAIAKKWANLLHAAIVAAKYETPTP